jgi:hypothetical protein
MRLSFDALTLPAEKGLTLTAYSAEPNTPSAARMRQLIELTYGETERPTERAFAATT